MKKPLTSSFRTRLFGAFLAAALVPLLICSAMLLQIFRLRMTGAAEEEAREQLSSALRALDEGYGGFAAAVEALQDERLVLDALAGGAVADTQVFNRETMGLLYTVSASSALICVVISVIMGLSLSRQMFRPIAQLRGAIREVERDNLDVQVAQYRDDELGELAQRFNDMVAALKRSREKLVENQRELNEAQIRMLQAQLNPHFLCNTLDTMKWISKINKVPQVALMSIDLADILRFCIAPEEFVPLRREADILERYIEIQRIRLSNSFTFTLTLPVELEDCLVPKMILQPIVENAILHGVDGVEDGAVTVAVSAEPEGLLRITVADNGRGFPPDMVGGFRQSVQAEGRLGLYNVDTILLKYYGEGGGLTLENGAGGSGAVVTAALPIRREEERSC